MFIRFKVAAMSLIKVAAISLSVSLGADMSLPAGQPAEEPSSSYSSYYKKLRYEASLAYTKLSWSAWWTKIEPFNIYLGALPLGNKGHLEQIVDLGVDRVLSMVEDFEIEDGWINKPVKPADWEKMGIITKHIQAEDFLPLTYEEIDEGVEFLANSLREGHTVYVHCKAGRGRSATIVIAYLMEHKKLSFEEAFAFVKEQRPQINLNVAQREAILNYITEKLARQVQSAEEMKPLKALSDEIYAFFENANQMSEDKIAELLDQMLFYVIEGLSCVPSETQYVPEILSTWIPAIEIQSTLERRNRYLREYRGDQEAATQAAIARNHGMINGFKLLAVGSLPFVGAPTKQSISLWHQLREIALIAAINGHDMEDPTVKMKILSCLAGSSLLKIPALSVDLIVREIAKKIVAEAGLSSAIPGAIPAHFVFNYFTENSAQAAVHAKIVFAGENTLPVAEEAYW